MKFPYTLISVALLLAGCGEDINRKTFAAAQSPDGLLVATADDERHFGPGTAGDVLIVTLGRLHDRRAADDILVAYPPQDEPYPGQPTRHIQLRWAGPRRLEVTTHAVTVDKWVAKFAGVDVALTQVP